MSKLNSESITSLVQHIDSLPIELIDTIVKEGKLTHHDLIQLLIAGSDAMISYMRSSLYKNLNIIYVTYTSDSGEVNNMVLHNPSELMMAGFEFAIALINENVPIRVTYRKFHGPDVDTMKTFVGGNYKKNTYSCMRIDIAMADGKSYEDHDRNNVKLRSDINYITVESKVEHRYRLEIYYYDGEDDRAEGEMCEECGQSPYDCNCTIGYDQAFAVTSDSLDFLEGIKAAAAATEMLPSYVYRLKDGKGPYSKPIALC